MISTCWDREIQHFTEFGLVTAGVRNGQFDPPDIPNVDYWFSENVQRQLGLIRGHIDWIESPQIADFFRVAFSLTVRKVSWTKNSEFKLVRMTPARMEDHQPDVFETMVDVLNVNRLAFASLDHALCNPPQIPSVHRFDTVIEIPKVLIRPQSVDIIVTSPPYGDSKTTVAYGQFSRLSSQWLGYENANQVDNSLMGGSKHSGDVSFGFEELDAAIGEIADADPKRAGEVVSFFVDYRSSIRNIAHVVREGGYVSFVVGNRTVKGLEIPTAESTVAFFEMNGFDHVDTFQRNIPEQANAIDEFAVKCTGRIG